MERMPVELLRNVLQELDPSSLKNVRLASKRCSELATPILFSVIKLAGEGQIFSHVVDPQRYPKRSVEFGKLHEAIAEVLPLARSATRLVFAPAFYREGFWDDYRAYLHEQMEEPVDEVDIDYSEDGDVDGGDDGGDDEDEDGEESESETEEDRYEARIQAVIARRAARPEVERDQIREAEEHWNLKRQEQEVNSERVEASLLELISCTNLKEIEIQEWEFSGFGGLDFESYEIDGIRKVSSPTAQHLHLIARCLHKCGRHIEKLQVRALNPEMIQDSPAMRFAFEGLRHLRLDINHVDSLLEDSSFDHALPKLLEHAGPTLERLEMVSGSSWPQLPSRGVHSLGKIFNHKGTSKSLSFPNLRSFRLVSLIISTTSLLEFLTSQPKIAKLEFSYVYLATSGMGWKSLASALPASVEIWEVSGRLGHEPVAGFEPPIAYNWCADWNYFGKQLLTETGWKGELVDPIRTQFRRIENSSNEE
ncbi:unnamed protein product [Clonostachys rosea f. rosea IK726]|uniref:F-box domain-containing protein n=2 Tax=Bionectria ochroleuca TaxID=29856 RepID=A0A0B7KHR7_BIOOC|nr:unnamed protein product [Clonostachys rosea f. rosea IK726]